MEETPEIIWRPTAAAVESSNLTAYIDWLRAERGVDVAAYPELWRWSVDDLEAFWNSIFDYFQVEYDGERGPALASREMPGADWFPGIRLNWAERAFAGKDDDQVAILHASELRELERSPGASCARRSRAGRGGAERPRRRVRRPRRRLPPEHRRGDGRLPRRRLDRRGLVLRLPRLRRRLADRPLRPDRAEGPDRGGRLPLRRQGLRPHPGGAAAPGGDAVGPAYGPRPLPRPGGDRDLRLGRARGSDHLGRSPRLRRRRRAHLRAGPLRPPALGPLLLGDHRPPQGDRPGPGRHPDRAAEEDAPPPRREARRPPLLVHDDGLDDVELHRLGPPDRGGDRPLRRQPRIPRPGRPLGPRGEGTDHHLRHLGRLRLGLHEGGGRAGGGPGPLPPARGRQHGQPAGPRGLRLGPRPPGGGHLALLHLGRHRRLHRLRRRGADPPRLQRRAAGPGAGLQGRGLGRGGQQRDR